MKNISNKFFNKKKQDLLNVLNNLQINKIKILIYFAQIHKAIKMEKFYFMEMVAALQLQHLAMTYSKI